MTARATERSDAARAVTPHDPIEFILAEHLNHRRMCKALERLAEDDEFDAARITSLLDYIRFDLTLHVIDEEEDFFPLLRKRCHAEDDVEDVLARLSAEHAEDKVLSANVRDMLNACLILRKPPAAIEGGAAALIAFAENERRHLTLENAVIVPLARRRLNAGDLENLSQRFLARRRRLTAPDE
ncbi:MAG TPA: hemerythrin domain-containing protein [Vitreimonas sp.]|uniref:hemerythrin domain-containing protein n=1 Tax=Vitreimonas sp. TaxID=3069702 RepID=UPI002D4771D9|nr:hemerythrin domain-containing protein [Vitreimonas sp.]HYD89310.1 hemerythrin domain-containing protein [Vitreimonas sp.]